MKKILALICTTILLQQTLHAQKQPAYNFPANGWKVEKAVFPLSFAPGIAYKGTDEIRFMPGFENAQANSYFSYCFLWYLDGTVKFTADQLTTDVKAYYNGLGYLNNGTTVTIKKTTPAANFQHAFNLVIQTTDNLYTHKSLLLNGAINITTCNGGNNTIAFFEVSPKPMHDKIWKALDDVRESISWQK